MKTKITIEMTDEEYETYKDFLNGKYVKKEQVENDITKYLEVMGFKKTNSKIYNADPLGRNADAIEVEYKKEKTKITITAWQ